MNATTHPDPTSGEPAAACPMHPHGNPRRFVDADDELVLPLHKRVVVQYAKNDEGATELRLFYGDKEISFDEPEIFGFGEALARQARFVARTATDWGQGQPWARVQELLGQLIDEGILHYADERDGAAAAPGDGARASLLPPAQTTVARTWFECEDVTRELTGRPLELGYLELVIPVFRVAHMSLDADGRQVGEANVFPPALRLDVPTNWRACIYPGTRYMDARPMNVTALKGMRAHWARMMAAILRIRAAYLKRFPEATRGWTVGHLERLSAAVLAVPTYQLMRMDAPVENGRLHPALSSLFRVTDGVRMTMHQMLFIPIGEPTTAPDAPMTAAGILDYAERNYSFHSDFGVCAGPRSMMEEFLAVLVDGVPARNTENLVPEPAVEAALADLEPAIDYALHGLRAYAAVFSRWPIMTRTYERLWEIVQAWAAAGGPQPVTALMERMRGIMENLKTATYLGTEQWRVDRETVYADMYRQCGIGLRIPEAAQSLTDRIAPRRDAALLEVGRRLRTMLARHFGSRPGVDDLHLDAMLECIIDNFSQEQALLGVACDTQQQINDLLHRPAPTRPFTAAEIDIHILLQGRRARHVPDLASELQSVLGVGISVTRHGVEITDRAPGAGPAASA